MDYSRKKQILGGLRIHFLVFSKKTLEILIFYFTCRNSRQNKAPPLETPQNCVMEIPRPEVVAAKSSGNLPWFFLGYFFGNSTQPSVWPNFGFLVSFCFFCLVVQLRLVVHNNKQIRRNKQIQMDKELKEFNFQIPCTHAAQYNLMFSRNIDHPKIYLLFYSFRCPLAS